MRLIRALRPTPMTPLPFTLCLVLLIGGCTPNEPTGGDPSVASDGANSGFNCDSTTETVALQSKLNALQAELVATKARLEIALQCEEADPKVGWECLQANTTVWKKSRFSPLKPDDIQKLQYSGCVQQVEQFDGVSTWEPWFIAPVPRSLFPEAVKTLSIPFEFIKDRSYNPQTDWTCRRL